MKVKLLKKLRKLARKQYWLEYHKDHPYSYWTVSPKCSKGCALMMSMYYEDALLDLEKRRVMWILDYINDRRNYKLDV